MLMVALTDAATRLTVGMTEAKSTYSNLFDAMHSPRPPFNKAAYTEFSKSLLSNLLGGIGYFYGDSKVDRSHASDREDVELPKFPAKPPTPEKPKELFSLVPSRPVFPWSFLWDEGFHLLVVLEWDLDLAMEIVQSWLGLMDQDGWIARGQILGAEARSKVTAEFQVQYPQHANPPTLFLVVSAFVDIVAGNKTFSGHPSQYTSDKMVTQQLFAGMYPLLKRHYHWFRRTQSGDLQNYARPGHSANEAYRWRGRTDQHTLTSGLDDYPRAQPAHRGELHLDALTWVASMAGVLKKVAAFSGESEERLVFARHERAIKRNIDSLHCSEEEQAYCDATVEQGRHSLVCHKGYISLFPFLVGLMDPKHKHLGAVLDLIQEESELWSSHGIRSFSKKDHFYCTRENYWRSPVWLNINFLITKRLLVSNTNPRLDIYTPQGPRGLFRSRTDVPNN